MIWMAKLDFKIHAINLIVLLFGMKIKLRIIPLHHMLSESFSALCTQKRKYLPLDVDFL